MLWECRNQPNLIWGNDGKIVIAVGRKQGQTLKNIIAKLLFWWMRVMRVEGGGGLSYDKDFVLVLAS